MAVYLVAFALACFFIYQAEIYYKRITRFKFATESGNGRCLYTPINFSRLRYTPAQLQDFRWKYRIFFLLAFFPIFFIVAVRYDVGVDYFYTYVPEWNNILNGARPFDEFIFNYLIVFIQLFTDNSQWLFVVTGFIFTFIALRSIVRYSPNSALSVLILFVSCIFFWSLNNVRQAIAVIIIFASFPCLVKKQFIKYIVGVAFAFAFHKSALIMIFPYFLVNIKFIRKNYLFSILIITLCLPIMSLVFEKILLGTKYEYFFISDFNNGQSNTANIIYNAFFFALAFLVLYKEIGRSKIAFVLLNMQFLCFWVSAVSLFIRIGEMIARVTIYFQVFQILLIPFCMSRFKKKQNKIVFSLIYILAYAVYLTYFIVVKGYHGVLPYKWIF